MTDLVAFFVAEQSSATWKPSGASPFTFTQKTRLLYAEMSVPALSGYQPCQFHPPPIQPEPSAWSLSEVLPSWASSYDGPRLSTFSSGPTHALPPAWTSPSQTIRRSPAGTSAAAAGVMKPEAKRDRA